MIKLKCEGKGKLVFPDNSYYIGDFKEGRRIQGKVYYSEEKGVFDAKWEYNEKTKETIAKGIFYYPDGRYQKRARIIKGKKGIWKLE